MWTEHGLWRFTFCVLLAIGTLAVSATGEEEVPSEVQCRPYIEKALKGLEAGSVEDNDSGEAEVENDTKENSAEDADGDSDEAPSLEVADEPYVGAERAEALTAEDDDSQEEDAAEDDSKEVEGDEESTEDNQEESGEDKEGDSQEHDDEDKDGSKEADDDSEEKNDDEADSTTEDTKSNETDDVDSKEVDDGENSKEDNDDDGSREDDDANDSAEQTDDKTDKANDESEEVATSNAEDDANDDKSEEKSDEDDKSDEKSNDEDNKSGEDDANAAEETEEADDKSEEGDDSAESKAGDDDKSVEGDDGDDKSGADDDSDETKQDNDDDEDSAEGAPEEDLLKVGDIPKNLRSRDHIAKILRLDEEASEDELTIERSADIVLRDLKKLYENAIKPLETLYKYRDLSNRHFGDPEIFSKPLVLFMGPWSGGKSSLVNYLTGIEFTEWSLRTGAEPSPAYFNILMHGKEPEVLDGTQLAADWTFSGLQKFGQGLEERLRGLKYPSKLLEKVNIVEIPGILEVRKQVSRVFPFNDACQWFIDRADIIFLVYDPSKLDVGPETEAILDQLKGREPQTRILLNKADTVKPEELMRVQSALIWNISPLMSSAQPPVMYTASLWSLPYDPHAPARLLQAQERELLKDLRSAIDRRIDNKIASARRFAVRVRNHAKMVDCYLTTYYNHKTIFGNKKQIAEAIIENPQNYHIYEGLSTLTNISRYDLPDPETYRDFFRLNAVYDFPQLSATCTYFRGCPINKLDIAIAYDFPELVGKYKKMVESATPQGMPKS